MLARAFDPQNSSVMFARFVLRKKLLLVALTGPRVDLKLLIFLPWPIHIVL